MTAATARQLWAQVPQRDPFPPPDPDPEPDCDVCAALGKQRAGLLRGAEHVRGH